MDQSVSEFVKSTEYFWIYSILFQACTLLIIAMFINYSTKIYQDLYTSKRKSVSHRGSPPKITTVYRRGQFIVLITVFSFMLSSIFGTISFFKFSRPLCQYQPIFSGTTYQMGKMFHYLTNILRMYTVYGSSAYAYSKYLLCFLATLFTIWIISSIAGYILYSSGDGNLSSIISPVIQYCHQYYPLWVFISNVIQDFIASVTYLILFITPLRKTLRAMYMSNANNNSTTSKIVYIGTKVTMCTVTTMISTFIMYTFALSTGSILLMPIDMVINCICNLMMTAYYPDNIYYSKLCCLALSICPAEKVIPKMQNDEYGIGPTKDAVCETKVIRKVQNDEYDIEPTQTEDVAYGVDYIDQLDIFGDVIYDNKKHQIDTQAIAMQVGFNERTETHEVNSMDDDMDLTKPLPLPYKNGFKHKFKYNLETFLVTHPRVYAIYLLYKSTWSRGLVIFDMYTDCVIAYGLYKGNHLIWFTFSCLFIALPFALVWSASLRFIQVYLQAFYDKLHTTHSKHISRIQTLVNIVLMIYLFPPIGSIFIALYEIYWVLKDIFNGFKSFIFGTGLIEAEDQQTNAMKSYRRTIEIFAESIPQTALQLYIFINFNLRGKDSGINPNDLYLSIVVSLLNLCITLHRFSAEASLHGMSWSEYALSALQLAEIPIVKLVPRLPAIRKGKLEEVNFSGFVFDKQSLTPLLEAVNSAKCNLKRIQLSIGSLAKLDIESCKMLGSLLKNARITVSISRTTSLFDIKKLFESIDLDNNGYLDENEFLSAVKKLNCPIQNASKEKQQRVFQQLAIRRIKQRDRVYFYDFFYKTASFKDHTANTKINFDLTLIDLPIHYILQTIKQFVENKQNDDKEQFDDMKKLFEFCLSMESIDKSSPIRKQHIFYAIIDAFYTINLTEMSSETIQSVAELVWTWFLKLVKSPILNYKLYSRRDDTFKYPEIEQNVQINPFMRNNLVDPLKKVDCTGFNIFEYCLIFEDYPQCEAFAYLLETYLMKIQTQPNYLENLISFNSDNDTYGALYHLFKATNGFHVDYTKHMTPLQYAAKNNLYNVVEFFVKCVLENDVMGHIVEEDEKTTDFDFDLNLNWVNKQSYLHSVVYQVFTTKAKYPDSNILQLLLSTNKINVNYGAHRFLASQLMYSRQSEKDEFLLKCLEILNKYNYDFVNNIEESTKHNILHDAIKTENEAAVALILKLIQNDDQTLSKLLQHQNKKEQTPLEMAQVLELDAIVKILQHKIDDKNDNENYIEH